MKKLIFVFCMIALSVQLPLLAQIKYLEFMDKQPKSFPIQLVNCQYVAKPPVIDGILDDETWENAEKKTAFRITDKVGFGKLATRQTEVSFVHDNKFLYIAFTCFEPKMDKVRAENKRFDNPEIFYDDRIEILLDLYHDHKNIVRLAVNSLGVTYDTKLERPVQYSISYIKGSDNWNTEWRAKTQKYADRWTGEVAIAIDRIFDREISSGITWGFNIVRDSHSEFLEGGRGVKLKPGRELSALEPVKSYVKGKISDSWIEPNLYADLTFNQEKLDVIGLKFHEAYANYNGSIWHKPQFFGDNPLFVSTRNKSGSSLKVRCVVETESFDGKTLLCEEVFEFQPKESKELKMPIKIRSDERLVFHLRLYDDFMGELLYETSYDTRVPPFVEFDLSSIYALDESQNNSILVATVVVPSILVGSSIEMTLFDKAGNTLATDRLSGLKNHEFVPCFEKLALTSLSAGNYTISCEFRDNKNELIGVFDHFFTNSLKQSTAELKAENTVYSFGGKEGKSLTVNFPEGERFVFWEHASYVPWWDLDNMAVTYEFMETWGYGNQGCSEPMQDKENRYSKPEIVENSPARVVVLWRYALSDPNYQIFFNEWVYEYYYLYPDGTGVREICVYPNSNVQHEVLQPQYIFPTGVIPEQMFQDTACVLMNTKGEKISNLLSKPVLAPPKSTGEWEEEIMRIYLKNRKHPYLVWSKDEELFPNPINNGLIVGDVQRSMGGHWPLQPMNVDVYSVVGTNLPYHSWLGTIHVYPDIDKQPNKWVHLIGITNKSNEELIKVAENWLEPSIPHTENVDFIKFDKIQKAYIFNNIQGEKYSLKFPDIKEKEITHPVFVFSSSTLKKIKLFVNGKEIPSKLYRLSNINYQYHDATLLWLGVTIKENDKVDIVKLTN